MRNINIPVVSSEACTGREGSYFAFTYLSNRRDIEPRQVQLGRYTEELLNTRSLISMVCLRLRQQELNLKNVAPLPVQYLAAIGVVRSCDRAHHDYPLPHKKRQDGKLPAPLLGAIGERVASYVLLKPNSDIHKIDDIVGRSGPRGFRHALLSHGRKGHVETDRLIYLPATPEEERTHLPRAAVAAIGVDIARGHEPFVAIHTAPDGQSHIEQLVDPDRAVA